MNHLLLFSRGCGCDARSIRICIASKDDSRAPTSEDQDDRKMGESGGVKR